MRDSMIVAALMIGALTASTGAAPVVRPASGPATIPTAGEALRLASLKAELLKAKAESHARFESSPKYIAARNLLASKERALAAARSGDVPEQKLTASSEYTAAKAAFDRIRASAPTDPEVERLVQEVGRLEAAVEAENVRLRAELAKADQDRAEAKKESEIPEVTAAQLETLGERYKMKSVKLTGCKFASVSTTWIDNMPGVAVQSNGLITIVNVREHEKWIGLSLHDAKGALFMKAFASKKDYGDILVAMKRGELLNIRGIVIDLDQTTDYGLVCTRIEVVKAPAAEDEGEGRRKRPRESDGPGWYRIEYFNAAGKLKETVFESDSRDAAIKTALAKGLSMPSSEDEAGKTVYSGVQKVASK